MGTTGKVILMLALIGGAGYLGYTWFTKLPPAQAASMAMGVQDYERAIPYLEKAFEQDQKNMDLVLDLAECYDRVHNMEMCRKMYRFANDYLQSKPNTGKYSYHHERVLMLNALSH